MDQRDNPEFSGEQAARIDYEFQRKLFEIAGDPEAAEDAMRKHSELSIELLKT